MKNEINISALLDSIYPDVELKKDLLDLPVLHFGKGDYIYKVDDRADVNYLLIRGTVKLIAGSDTGREIIKSIIVPGEIFGEISNQPQEKRKDNALTGSESVCLVITPKSFADLIQKHKSFSAATLKNLTGKLSDIERKLESLLFMDSKSRIIAWLVEQTEKRGQRIGYEWAVRNFVTHQEIANITATSRQSVTTALNELRDMGIITFDRRRLLVRDLDKLKAEIR